MKMKELKTQLDYLLALRLHMLSNPHNKEYRDRLAYVDHLISNTLDKIHKIS